MHKKKMLTCLSVRIAGILSLYMIIAATTSVAGPPLPVFAEHHVTERFTGTPAKPDLTGSPDAKRYATTIREGAKTGPNFAGHFTIIEWGCGSECQRSAIVDAKTGAVYFPEFTSSWGMLYRPDSNLLIVNPIDPQAVADDRVPAWMVTEFYQWDGRKLVKLAESKDMIIDPQTGAASKPQPKRLTVIDYYNRNKHDNLRIEQRDGAWKGQGDSGWYPLKVADIANGYVEYEDPGYNNGAGFALFSAALFLTSDQKPMFALLQTVISNEQGKCPKTTFTLETYRMDGDQMVEAVDVLPPLPLSLFMKKGTSMEKIANGYAIGYRLPRKGTTVEAFLDTSSPYCVKELLKDMRTDTVKLKWNKASGKFDLQTGQ